MAKVKTDKELRAVARTYLAKALQEPREPADPALLHTALAIVTAHRYGDAEK